MNTSIEHNIEIIALKDRGALKDRVKILVISFEGEVGSGSEGNLDAQSIIETIKSQIAVVEPNCLVADFSRLTYDYGNMMMKAVSLRDEYAREYVPQNVRKAIVVRKIGRKSLLSRMKSKLFNSNELYFDNVDRALESVSR